MIKYFQNKKQRENIKKLNFVNNEDEDEEEEEYI